MVLDVQSEMPKEPIGDGVGGCVLYATRLQVHERHVLVDITEQLLLRPHVLVKVIQRARDGKVHEPKHGGCHERRKEVEKAEAPSEAERLEHRVRPLALRQVAKHGREGVIRPDDPHEQTIEQHVLQHTEMARRGCAAGVLALRHHRRMRLYGADVERRIEPNHIHECVVYLVNGGRMVKVEPENDEAEVRLHDFGARCAREDRVMAHVMEEHPLPARTDEHQKVPEPRVLRNVSEKESKEDWEEGLPKVRAPPHVVIRKRAALAQLLVHRQILTIGAVQQLRAHAGNRFVALLDAARNALTHGFLPACTLEHADADGADHAHCRLRLRVRDQEPRRRIAPNKVNEELPGGVVLEQPQVHNHVLHHTPLFSLANLRLELCGADLALLLSRPHCMHPLAMTLKLRQLVAIRPGDREEAQQQQSAKHK